MSTAVLIQLIIALGPSAFALISDLLKITSKPELTVEEVLAYCDRSKKTYEQYIEEARVVPATK